MWLKKTQKFRQKSVEIQTFWKTSTRSVPMKISKFLNNFSKLQNFFENLSKFFPHLNNGSFFSKKLNNRKSENLPYVHWTLKLFAIPILWTFHIFCVIFWTLPNTSCFFVLLMLGRVKVHQILVFYKLLYPAPP